MDGSAFDRHLVFVARMALSVRCDLLDGLARGLYSRAVLDDMVRTCIACPSKQACAEFAEAHVETGTTTPPSFCRNQPAIDRCNCCGVAVDQGKNAQ